MLSNMIFFSKGSKLKIIKKCYLVGGREASVSEFFTKNLNKKKLLCFFFLFFFFLFFFF